MSETLSGLAGVVCMIDDVLVHCKMQEEHDERLEKVLQRLQKVTLNSEKCRFAQKSVKFLGHCIDGTGIRPDPESHGHPESEGAHKCWGCTAFWEW